MKRLIIIIFIFLIGCKSTNEKCSFQYAFLNKTTYNVKGCLIDSLEEGEWIVLDTLNNVIEKGKYENGIRVGEWHYSNKKSPDEIIVWRKFNDKELSIRTNIPDNFKVVNKENSFVKLADEDTAHKLNLVFAMHNLVDEGINIDSFYKQSENEIIERGWNYQYQRNKLVSNGNIFYMNWYKISKEKDQLDILNFYGSSANKRLVEVTVTFDTARSRLARVLFTSIVSNYFVDSIRFINPFNKIENITVL